MAGNATRQDGGSVARVENVAPLTPHNKALYEAGKSLIVESVNVGSEFCKYMIGISAGAIGVYLSLIKLIVPEGSSLSYHQKIMAMIPNILFVLSMIIFTNGYFPRRAIFSLDIFEEIDQARINAINHRYRWAIWGFAVLCIGLCIGAMVVIVIEPLPASGAGINSTPVPLAAPLGP
jgi:hypothetical protein